MWYAHLVYTQSDDAHKPRLWTFQDVVVVMLAVVVMAVEAAVLVAVVIAITVHLLGG
jgi:hypothetical protein